MQHPLSDLTDYVLANILGVVDLDELAKAFEQVKKHHQWGQDCQHMGIFFDKNLIQHRLDQIGRGAGTYGGGHHPGDGDGEFTFVLADIGPKAL